MRQFKLGPATITVRGTRINVQNPTPLAIEVVEQIRNERIDRRQNEEARIKRMKEIAILLQK